MNPKFYTLGEYKGRVIYAYGLDNEGIEDLYKHLNEAEGFMPNYTEPPKTIGWFMGNRGGNTLLRKYGTEYFKNIQSMRKTHGKQKKG